MILALFCGDSAIEILTKTIDIRDKNSSFVKIKIGGLKK